MVRAAPRFSLEMTVETPVDELRRIYGKFPCRNEEVVASALDHGANRLDLFFMIGLPRQTYLQCLETVDGCPATVRVSSAWLPACCALRSPTRTTAGSSGRQTAAAASRAIAAEGGAAVHSPTTSKSATEDHPASICRSRLGLRSFSSRLPQPIPYELVQYGS